MTSKARAVLRLAIIFGLVAVDVSHALPAQNPRNSTSVSLNQTRADEGVWNQTRKSTVNPENFTVPTANLTVNPENFTAPTANLEVNPENFTVPTANLTLRLQRATSKPPINWLTMTSLNYSSMRHSYYEATFLMPSLVKIPPRLIRPLCPPDKVLASDGTCREPDDY